MYTSKAMRRLWQPRAATSDSRRRAGIAGKIEPYLVESSFRERFEAKGRLSPFVKAIPTRLIINPNAALLGAARAAEEVRLLRTRQASGLP